MTCIGCKHYLGGGCCRLNLEYECADGGYELYEFPSLRELMERAVVII